MRKFIISNLLPIMFLVGAASGFIVSNIGWWGLYQGAQDLEQVYSAGNTKLQQLSEVQGRLLQTQALFLEILKKQQLFPADAQALARSDAELKQNLDKLQQQGKNTPYWRGVSQTYAQLSASREQALSLLAGDPNRSLRFYATETQPLQDQLSQSLRHFTPVIIESANVAYNKAASDNRFARMALLLGAVLAALFFCLSAWLTYRQSRDRVRKTDDLDRAHSRFRTLFESAEDGIILMQMERFIDCNRSALRLFGIPTVKIFLNGSVSRLQPTHQPDGALSGDTFRSKLTDSLTHKLERFEWLFKALDGKTFLAEVAIDVIRLGDENIIQLTIHDIRKRKQDEDSTRLANQVFDNSLEGIVITDSNCNILKINPAFTSITGYSSNEVVGKNPRLLSSGRQSPEFYAEFWSSLNEHGRWQGEIWNSRKNREIYPQWLNISRVLDKQCEPINYIAVFSDLSEQKTADQRILRQRNYDQLTDLPNRTFFTERVNQLFALAWRNPATSLAVMFIDLDRLKVVNDSMGHGAGDKLLQMVALRLTECIRKTDTVARISGDEFAILLSKISDPQDAAGIAEKLLQQFQQPFAINGAEIFISLSIGVSVFPGDGLDAEQMLQNANIAMNRVKETGGARYELYDEDFGLRATQRMATETGLRKAVEHNEFELSYQPQFECDSGELIGFEALLRWRHPELGLLFPDSFIGIAEETGLIVPIGAWVLQTACAQAQAWRQHSVQPRLIAVNLSARQFQHPGLVQQVKSALHDSGLPASCLELEITESILMKEIDVSVKVMHELAELGVQFSIDDFGTGYSSLAYLKKMPIQSLKIDKSFIRDIVTNADDAAIVNAILAMSNQLGLRVVAEGIEEKEQLAYLINCGGIVGQGYFLGRPVTAQVMTSLMQKDSSETVSDLLPV